MRWAAISQHDLTETLHHIGKGGRTLAQTFPSMVHAGGPNFLAIKALRKTCDYLDQTNHKNLIWDTISHQKATKVLGAYKQGCLIKRLVLIQGLISGFIHSVCHGMLSLDSKVS